MLVVYSFPWIIRIAFHAAMLKIEICILNGTAVLSPNAMSVQCVLRIIVYYYYYYYYWSMGINYVRWLLERWLATFLDLDLVLWTFCSCNHHCCVRFTCYYKYVLYENVIPNCTTRMCMSSCQDVSTERSCFTFLSSGCLVNFCSLFGRYTCKPTCSTCCSWMIFLHQNKS